MQNKFNQPKTIPVALAVAKVTFKEIVRDKVLYNIFLCAIALFAIGFLAGRLSFIRQDRIILDFGLSALGISCAVIAIFTGASLIGREFDRRTIFVALSRPVSRIQFVFGKFLGLSGVIATNWLLLNLALFLIMSLSAGDPSALMGRTFFFALGLVLIQSLMLAALTVFFSSFTTTSLAVIFSIGVYMAGNNVSHLKLLATKMESELSAAVIKGLAALIPNLEYFNLGPQVSYALPVNTSYIAYSVAYGLVVITLAVLLAGVFVNRRES